MSRFLLFQISHMAGFYAFDSHSLMHAEVKGPFQAMHSCSSLSDLPHPNYVPIVDLNDKLAAPVEIHGSDASHNTCITIWLTLDEIPHVHHPLYDIDSLHCKQLNDSFPSHSSDCNLGLISVTARPPVTEPPNRFDLLKGDGQKQMLQGGGRVGLVDRCPHLNVLI